jgi:hypothetical protein
VRVEVLGVLDRATRNVRLRATEPIAGASQQERFAKIFEPLSVWVNKSCRIVTDYSVDRDSVANTRNKIFRPGRRKNLPNDADLKIK